MSNNIDREIFLNLLMINSIILLLNQVHVISHIPRVDFIVKLHLFLCALEERVDKIGELLPKSPGRFSIQNTIKCKKTIKFPYIPLKSLKIPNPIHPRATLEETSYHIITNQTISSSPLGLIYHFEMTPRESGGRLWSDQPKVWIS